MTRISTGVIAMLAASTQLAGQPTVKPTTTAIPLWSESLARAVDPSQGPFVSTYHSRGKMLGFVAASHVSTPENSTVDAIRRAFADTSLPWSSLRDFPQHSAEILPTSLNPCGSASRRAQIRTRGERRFSLHHRH